MKKLLLTFLLLLSMMTFALAQMKVTGKISANGEPLVGASVVEKGTSNGVVTDLDGNFSLSVKEGSSLQVSMVGFETQDITVGKQSIIDVSMTEGSVLSEVIVTALGIERAQKTLTYAAQKIDGSQVNQVRDANFVNTLSGKAAGIVVTQAADGPGSATRIVMRGNRSIQGNNNALFVIDGVPIDNSIPAGNVGNDFGGYQGSDGAANINPDDIESMSILKGAAASVLYGSRAGNGVVLITTKKGKAGKISVDVNSGIVTESPMILPDLQNVYGQGNGGTSNATSNGSWGGKTTTYADNVKGFFRNAISLNNSIGITGGTDKMATYFSYTNNRAQGIISNNDLGRNTFTLRINNQFSKRFSTDAKISYITQNINNKIKVGEESGIVQNLYKIPRSISLETAKEFEDKDGNPKSWATSSIYMNPYWTLNRVLNDEKRNRIISLFSAKYAITDWLSLTGRASIDKYNDKVTRKFYDKTLLFAQSGGSYQEGYYDVKEQNLEAFLQGNNKFTEDLGFNYTIGTAVSRSESAQTFGIANGLLVPNKFDLSFARSRSTGTFDFKREIQSVYASASFSYKDYLYLDIQGRNDWSSRLPKETNAYFYPSVGLGLVVSDMTKMPDWVSYMKLRGSWTRVGNGDLRPNILAQTYSFQQGGTGGFIQRDGTLPFPDAKPEIQTSIEAGIDWRMFHNRLGFDLTFYKTNSVNQLLELSLAAASGFDRQFINSGDIQNSGVELTMNIAPIRQAKGLNWDMAVNFARNVSTVVSLNPEIKQAFLAGGYGRTAGPIVKEGERYGELYGEGWLKDDQGRRYVDANGKPLGSTTTLTVNGNKIGGSQVSVGNYNPNFTLGLNNTLSYGNLSLSFLLDGRFGGVMVSGSEANFAFDGTGAYTSAFRDGGLILDGVTATGEKNTKAINAETFWTTVSGGRYSFGEFFTYDATNVRIRELILGYNFKLNNNTIKNVRVSLVGRNLAFLYRGKATLDIAGMPERRMNFDPDINLGAGNYQGVEYGSLPSTRTIGLNLQLGF
jgi:TonB-linked SusC/RagA family outer membrane protein